jgi:alkanesulfonate monooxygenase SsuD/methylene tetrahydromethanopterin reductase-like flavin-dependent oxidoreductase (luciferase family)
MKLGVILPLFSGDPGKVLAAAEQTERLGFDGVFVFDHLFPPGAPPDRPSLEAFTTLAGVAAATRRSTVGTLVTRVGLRTPGMLAKMASWVDHVSGGRLVLGLGTGDPIDLPEHRAYGIPMLGKADRRGHLREVVAALRALFAGRRFPGGRFVPPLRGPLDPPPITRGGPPIWIGGQAEDVVRMAGQVGDGWNGWGLDPAAFAQRTGLLHEVAAEANRTAEGTWAGIVLAGEDHAETEELLRRRRARGMDDEIWAGTAEQLVAFLEGLREAGATWAVVVLAGPPDRRSLVAERVLPALRAAVGSD